MLDTLSFQKASCVENGHCPRYPSDEYMYIFTIGSHVAWACPMPVSARIILGELVVCSLNTLNRMHYGMSEVQAQGTKRKEMSSTQELVKQRPARDAAGGQGARLQHR